MSANSALMKRAAVWFWCALALLGSPGGAQSIPAKSVQHAQLHGRDYVRLRDWAQANGSRIKWFKRDKVVEIAGRYHRLLVVANSARVELDGVYLWLSFPAIPRNDGFYISSLDLQTMLYPLFFPPRSPQKIHTICIDPGHGGKDTGNRIGSQDEKKYTLLLARELQQQLMAAGLRVIMTRTADTFVALEDRPQKALRAGADVFVSLHFNATPVARNEVRGSEVYCLTPLGAASTNTRGRGATSISYPGNRCNSQNILLAYQIQKALTRNSNLEDRGVRRARFQVLREATMPSVVIEAGFMSHPVEGRMIFDPAFRHQVAKTIATGILAYKRTVEQPWRLFVTAANLLRRYGGQT
jgi:N-acetylmuramoyl-L-alanine amidase